MVAAAEKASGRTVRSRVVARRPGRRGRLLRRPGAGGRTARLARGARPRPDVRRPLALAVRQSRRVPRRLSPPDRPRSCAIINAGLPASTPSRERVPVPEVEGADAVHLVAPRLRRRPAVAGRLPALVPAAAGRAGVGGGREGGHITRARAPDDGCRRGHVVPGPRPRRVVAEHRLHPARLQRNPASSPTRAGWCAQVPDLVCDPADNVMAGDFAHGASPIQPDGLLHVFYIKGPLWTCLPGHARQELRARGLAPTASPGSTWVTR